MEKTVNATFDGEVFRPDEPLELASNTKVKVIIDEEEPKEVVGKPKKGKGEPYAFLKMARALKLRGPSDFSENLDDYLYGGKPFPDGK